MINIERIWYAERRVDDGARMALVWKPQERAFMVNLKKSNRSMFWRRINNRNLEVEDLV